MRNKRGCPPLPIVKKSAVWHIGEPTPRAQKPHSSMEGLSFSVSECPDAWGRIAQIGGPVFKLTPLAPRKDGVFFDYHRASKKLQATLRSLAFDAGLLVMKPLWSVPAFDEDGETVGTFDFATREEAEAEAGDDDLPITESVEPYASDALKEIWASRYSGPLKTGGELEAWQVVLERLCPDLDGFWWDDDLDVPALSAPRGGIFFSRLPRWKWEPSDESEAPLSMHDENPRRNADERPMTVEEARKILSTWGGYSVLLHRAALAMPPHLRDPEIVAACDLLAKLEGQGRR